MNTLIIFLIKGYQKHISKGLGEGKCKFVPTCSQYALEAFQKYGFFKAFLLSTWRVLRCNPWSKGGYDPLK